MAGTVSKYTDATISNPSAIAAGPDGALWFTSSDNDSIGRVTTAGVVTSYTDATISKSSGIAAGADGALWFANRDSSSIGRITTAGVVKNYVGIALNPESIAAGPDGNLWFTNPGYDTIGRITVNGKVKTFPINTLTDNPNGITAGPDGALWFTVFDGDGPAGSVWRITTTGKLTPYSEAGLIDPIGIAAGPDGALWFANATTDSRPASIGRVTTNFTPAFNKLAPTSGAVGSSVTLTGKNLGGATHVRFHGVEAAIGSNTATQIVVTVPAGATTGDVVVTTPYGTTMPKHFKVVP